MSNLHNPPPKGDCYEAALKFLRALGSSTNATLAHGNVDSLDQTFLVNHAWVEEEDVVHEVSNGRHLRISKARYYQQFKVKNILRYTYEEALIESVKSKSSGPW